VLLTRIPAAKITKDGLEDSKSNSLYRMCLSFIPFTFSPTILDFQRQFFFFLLCCRKPGPPLTRFVVRLFAASAPVTFSDFFLVRMPLTEHMKNIRTLEVTRSKKEAGSQGMWESHYSYLISWTLRNRTPIACLKLPPFKRWLSHTCRYAKLHNTINIISCKSWIRTRGPIKVTFFPFDVCHQPQPLPHQRNFCHVSRPRCEPLYATNTPLPKREIFFMNILSIESFFSKKKYNRTLLFGNTFLKHGPHFEY
jgi:hypothetical protein